MGATVIAVTRFPRDAARRYSREQDAFNFNDRLFIYGVDFRDVQMVHRFCHSVKQQFSRLDVIINNAAQTVRCIFIILNFIYILWILKNLGSSPSYLLCTFNTRRTRVS